MERKTLGFSVKATDGDGSTGTGIANAFRNVDTYGDITAPGAFVTDLPSFLSEGFIGGLNHDWDNPIGKPTAASETPDGLLIGWQISDTAHGRDVKTLLKDGVVRKLSIGYQTLGYTMLETADDVNAWWQAQGYTPSAQDTQRAAAGNVRLLTRLRVMETSPVVMPANDKADVRTVKAGALPATEREAEAALRELGFSRREAQTILATGYKTLLRDSEAAQKTGGAGSATNDAPAANDAYIRFLASNAAFLQGVKI